MNVVTTPTCVMCGRQRCYDCHTERHQISNREFQGEQSSSQLQSLVRQPAKSRKPSVPKPRVEREQTPRDKDNKQAHPALQHGVSTTQYRTGRPDVHADRTVITQVPKSAGNKKDQRTVSKSNKAIDVAQFPDMDDSTLSETETVFSTTSETTLLEDSVASISERLIIFHGLEQLWPQLIICCATTAIAKTTIENLLEWYSRDLAWLAAQKKPTEGKICSSTSKFIEKFRSRIAAEILASHGQRPEGKGNNNGTHHEGSDNMDGLLDEEDRADYSDYTYPIAEESMFEQAIQILQARVKALIRLDTSAEDSLLKKLYDFAEVLAMNTFARLYEPRLLPGQTRLRWNCVSSSLSHLTRH